MVKTNNTKFSTTSVAKGSVVLSRAVEKNFALEAEISRLRHHVSALSKRLHVVTLERRIFEDIVNQRQCPNCPGEGEPSGDVVAEGVEKMDATEEVADDRREVRPACEEVAEEFMEDEPQQVVAVFRGLGKVEPQVAEPVMEVDERYNRFALDLVPHDQEESIQVPLISQPSLSNVVVREDSGSPEGKYERMRTVFEEEQSRIKEEVEKAPKRIGEDLEEVSGSGEEDAVTGGMIVTVSSSQKAKKKRNKKKRKSKTSEEKNEEGYGLSEMKEELKLMNERRERNNLIIKDKEDQAMKMRKEINRIKAGMENKVDDSRLLEW